MQDICWDKLYIQRSTLPEFTKRNPELIVEEKVLEGTDDMYLLTPRWDEMGIEKCLK